MNQPILTQTVTPGEPMCFIRSEFRGNKTSISWKPSTDPANAVPLTKNPMDLRPRLTAADKAYKHPREGNPQHATGSAPDPIPPSYNELSSAYLNYLKARVSISMSILDNTNLKFDVREEIYVDLAALHGILAVLRDPISECPQMDIPSFRKVFDPWMSSGTIRVPFTLDQSFEYYLRGAHERTIMRIALEWNEIPTTNSLVERGHEVPCNNTCILTGDTSRAGEASIFNFAPGSPPFQDLCRAVSKFWRPEYIELWPLWPKPTPRAASQQGQQCNTIPLRADIRKLWENHVFALRPIQHPTDPDHRLLLQVVYIKDIASEANTLLRGYARDHEGRSVPVDFGHRQRPQKEFYPGLRHGDVYELITTDKKNHPLPNLQLLELRFAVQKVLAGMTSVACLKIIFRDPPPPPTWKRVAPVPPEIFRDNRVRLWVTLTDAAVEEGIIDDETAARWKQAISELVYARTKGVGEIMRRFPVTPSRT